MGITATGHASTLFPMLPCPVLVSTDIQFTLTCCGLTSESHALLNIAHPVVAVQSISLAGPSRRWCGAQILRSTISAMSQTRWTPLVFAAPACRLYLLPVMLSDSGHKAIRFEIGSPVASGTEHYGARTSGNSTTADDRSKTECASAMTA